MFLLLNALVNIDAHCPRSIVSNSVPCVAASLTSLKTKLSSKCDVALIYMNTFMEIKSLPVQSYDKVKLSLFVSPQLNETIESIALQSGSTKSDVLRKALALFEVATEARREGNRLGILTKDRQLLTEIVGV